MINAMNLIRATLRNGGITRKKRAAKRRVEEEYFGYNKEIPAIKRQFHFLTKFDRTKFIANES